MPRLHQDDELLPKAPRMAGGATLGSVNQMLQPECRQVLNDDLAAIARCRLDAATFAARFWLS